jgi:hypothetical protein
MQRDTRSAAGPRRAVRRVQNDPGACRPATRAYSGNSRSSWGRWWAREVVERAADLEVVAGGEPCFEEVLRSVPELELVPEPAVGVVVGGEDVVEWTSTAGRRRGRSWRYS